jgi:hypothetical protein
MLTGSSQSSTPNPPYHDVLKNNILSQDIPLGKTDKNGILIVDMNKKIKDAFLYTDVQREDISEDIFKGFFITATSKDSLSYNSSRWNA